MTVPLPETDLVLIREHTYRDSGDLQVVLPSEVNHFRPVSEAGLGTFNYRLVDMGSLFEVGTNNNQVEKSSLQTHMDDFTQHLEQVLCNDIAAMGFIVLLLIYVVYTCFTPKRKNKEKDDIDIDNEIDIHRYRTRLGKESYLDVDLESQRNSASLFSNGDSANVYTFHSNDSSDGPSTPVAGADYSKLTVIGSALDTDMFKSRLRID
jgi:hypothetical protein